MLIVKIFYNIILFVLIPFLMPIGYLMALKKKEDGDFFERLGFVTFPEPPSKSIWFHCASVGEVRSLKLITDMIKSDFPDLNIIVSTTTATGKQEAQRLITPYHAFLLPIENSLAVAHIIHYMNVRALIIIDTELWFNLINSAAKHTKLFMLNARMSDRSSKSYVRFRFVFAPLLSKFQTIYTKSADDTERFAAVTGNKKNIETLGNIKFQTRKPKPEPKEYAYLNGHKIFSAASTHKGEEEIIIEAFKKSGYGGKLVIAPRHMNRVGDVVLLAEKAGLTVSRLTEQNHDTQVIVSDKFGTLDELYAMSDRIFVGGSLDNTGGHNIYEAVMFEKQVCVGSNMANFREIFITASKYNAAVTVSSADDIARYITAPLTEADFNGFFSEMDAQQEGIMTKIKEAVADVSAG
ncbi:glycosyltransferase N-terminal domain-containing protein [Seleniivibrio sp.]|uniref:3-deoxy-D-manno-octulosonic acid transferase n=1 Tax=Seleniivibrio sp. TaxID=2898801 RepID=UPI0025EB80DD|nr:glycosyltransferase N-terminal domain-containing protein [Seleniivibrio sp.]MCD8553649.1 3-deoxy-D-manno-octulosonic acid transferase [Seleniivibrio sp.]